jgi:hypothetical protein
MKLLNYTKQFASMAIIASLFASCDKVKTVTPIGDGGQTLVKIIDGGAPGSKKFAIDFVNIPVTITAADLRRDIPNNTELNKTMKVTVKDDTAALRAYNPALVYMPASWYTVGATTPKTGGTGGIFNITLNPGEHAKPIDITIPNATLLDPSTTYGLAFTITSVDAGGVISVAKTIVIEIGAKNIYDGQYLLKGRHNRTPYDFPYQAVMHMITTGASSVIFYWPDAGSVGHPIGTGPDPINNVSWYGAAIAPNVIFNPATNLVTSVFNSGGATPIDIYTGAGSGVGRFEPGAKKMYVYWRYNANDLRGFMDTLTYIGPR